MALYPIHIIRLTEAVDLLNREYAAIALSDMRKTMASIAMSSLHEAQQTHNAIDKAISQRTPLDMLLAVMNTLMF